VAKPQRAREPQGTFKSNNELNEGWEPIEVGTPKPNPYAVKQPVGSSSTDAGKYGKKPTVRPTFGQVTTETY
jgi:hypothetical protein